MVIDSTWGDISRPQTRYFWLGAIHARWVVAIIGGPPCETWSQARERSIADHAFAPRVLRVPETPWGLPSLRLKELRQIRVGNDLMGFILEAVVMLYCVGGVAALEHPAAPTSEESVSIWRTPILALLLSLPGIELVSLAQGLWGAKSPKFNVFFACECAWHETSTAQVADYPRVTKGYLYRKGPSWRLVHLSFEGIPAIPERRLG